ncbi:MAG: DUF3540 domain-containing protein [Sandaracinaceae bacterium]
MDTAAKLTSEILQKQATVRAVVGPRLTVEVDQQTHDARRAASCLLAPRTGDSVIVAVPAAGPLWVLAILERQDEDAPHVLRVEGDLELDASEHVRVRASSGIEFATPGRFKVGARKLAVMAIDAALSTEQLSVVGRTVSAQAETLKSVWNVVDSIADRVTLHAKRSYRFIEEMDVTRAEQVDTRAEHTMHLRGKNTFLTAEDLAKIDGEQVHLG